MRMNDFDFDELDKAVNQLAEKTKQEHGDLSADIGSTPQAPVVPAASRSAVTPLPPKREEDETDKPVETVPSTPAVKPARRPTRLDSVRPNSGRAFMDIVPPSAHKMSTHGTLSVRPTKSVDMVKPASQPTEIPTSVKSEIAKVEDDLPMVIEQPKPPAVASSVQPHKEVDWPDPLDFEDMEPTKAPTEHTSKPIPEASVSPTPFLSEAKVEKRPLGAYSHFQTEPNQEQEKPALSETPELPVTDELTPEKDGTFKEPEAPVEQEKHEEPEEKQPEKVEAEPERPDLHGTAMMSIPQQYRAQDKPLDTSKRPIFDTKEYHPPLVDKAMSEQRGGSMWSKLFIALIVVVLLAVGGYLLYIFYFTPHP